MRANPWPEPEGVTFVLESVLWNELDLKYKAWFINACPRIYHRETAVSYSRRGKNRSGQQLVNLLYSTQYLLNKADAFGYTMKERIKKVIFYTVYKAILKSYGHNQQLPWMREDIVGTKNNILYYILRLPNYFLTAIYRKKYSC